MKLTRNALCCAVATSMLLPLTSLPAFAAKQAALEEVIVTARKREESIQDVPVSMTAFSGEKLDNAGYSDVASLSSVTPNLEMNSVGPTATFTYVRGIGTRRIDSGVDQSVGTFVDGLYRGRAYTTNTDLLMVERVEVLKGPQGTLYGKNTVGGAISITTREPDLEAWSGQFRYEPGFSGDGDDKFNNAFISISGPILPGKIGIAAVVSRRDSDGYQTILDDDPPTGVERQGLRGGSEDTLAGKLKLGWYITEALDLTLGINVSKSDSVANAFSLNDGGNPNAQIILINPLLPRPQLVDDPRVAISDYDAQVPYLNITTAMSRLRWQSDSITLQWIAGWEDAESLVDQDFDASGYDILTNITLEQAKQQSHELRFEYSQANWNMLLGGYYSSEQIDRKELRILGTDSIFSPLNGGQPSRLDFTSDFDVQSLAVFGQFNWAITDSLDLTLGLRQSKDEKQSRLISVNDLTVTAQALLQGTVEEYDVSLEDEWGSLDTLLSLSWNVLDDTMLYATLSSGYKSGGFQFLALTEDNARQILEPEFVDNYEFGVKSTLFDNRLRSNIAIFQMDYTNLQVLTFDSTNLIPVTVSENAAESRIKGVELELEAALSANWLMTVGYSYLDTEYDDYLQDPNDPSTQRAGNEMPNAPKNTATVGLNYSVDIGDGELMAGLRVSWKDSFFWEPDNNRPRRDQKEPELTKVDANIGYRHGAYYINLWGTNLTNKVYRSFNIDFGEDTINFDVFAPPRMVGLQLQYTWQ